MQLPKPTGSTETLVAKDGVQPDVERLYEKAWPISEHLKNENARDLFAWIGRCIAEVVGDAVVAWQGSLPDPLPMGVTFSFPMM